MIVKLHEPPKDICLHTFVGVRYTFSSPSLPLVENAIVRKCTLTEQSYCTSHNFIKNFYPWSKNTISFLRNGHAYRLGVIYTYLYSTDSSDR